MPQVAVFDLGKVMVDFDWSRGVKRLARHCDLSADALLKLFEYSSNLIRFELGEIGDEEFFNQTRKETGFMGSFEEFREAFSDIFVEIPPMLELHAMLRRAGVPTFIFSNTNILHADFIRSRFPFFSEFDGYVFSYKCGAMKPDPKIYEAVEELTGCRGGEILFLDDRMENVAQASARGWQALQHVNPETTREFVKSLGLLR